VLLSFTESTEPPTQSLFGDYFPVEERGRRLAIYNTLTGLVGGLLPLALTGVLVDRYGWRAVFLLWVPFGAVCAVLMRRMPEPERGNQDADFERELAEITAQLAESDTDDAEINPHALVSELAHADEERTEHPIDYDYSNAPWREVYGVICGCGAGPHRRRLDLRAGLPQRHHVVRRHLLQTRLPSVVAKAGATAAVIGIGALPGVLVGGYLADRLLQRGYVNARVWVLAVSLVAGPRRSYPRCSSIRCVWRSRSSSSPGSSVAPDRLQ